jgi:hypothetical protein
LGTYIYVGDNFCLCGEDEINCLDYPAPPGAGDEDPEACEEQCELSDDCSGFEFYAEDLHKGRSCHLVPADPPAVTSSPGNRWRDATCYVKPASPPSLPPPSASPSPPPPSASPSPPPPSASPSPPPPPSLTYIHVGDNFGLCGENAIDCLQYKAPPGAGDEDPEACEEQCELSDDCSGFEFYAEDLHKGRSCHLIPADPPAVTASPGGRWKDATCYVKPAN